MKLADLKPCWSNHLLLGTGIAFGVEFSCPNDPTRKRRHSVCFDPPINPYPDMQEQFAAIPRCSCQKWKRTGDTFDTLSLSPSIGNRDYKKRPDMPECCHITIQNGEVR